MLPRIDRLPVIAKSPITVTLPVTVPPTLEFSALLARMNAALAY